MCYTLPMNAITIPKNNFVKVDMVMLPRAEYESLKARVVPEYTPTSAERRAIIRARDRARKNYAAGKTITLDELKRKLARSH